MPRSPMPHLPELCAPDEMIPFKDEGDPEEEPNFPVTLSPGEERDLADIKSSLVHETEIHSSSDTEHDVGDRDQHGDIPDDGKHQGPSYHGFPTYTVLTNMSSDSYLSSGSMSPPVCRASNKVPVVQSSHVAHPLTPLITYGDEHFVPGSHVGLHTQDVNHKPGVPRHHPAPDIPGYYPPISPPLGWFSHHMVPQPTGPHPTGIPHPAIVSPQIKQEPQHDDEPLHMKPHRDCRKEQEPRKPHIKKPLNAFMLFMKETRADVVAECTLKESAAINQILGRRWHALSREEQAKYYELARKERQLHMQLYPGWSARDNYGKRKKRKREKIQPTSSEKHSSMSGYEEAKPLVKVEAC